MAAWGLHCSPGLSPPLLCCTGSVGAACGLSSPSSLTRDRTEPASPRKSLTQHRHLATEAPRSLSRFPLAFFFVFTRTSCQGSSSSDVLSPCSPPPPLSFIDSVHVLSISHPESCRSLLAVLPAAAPSPLCHSAVSVILLHKRDGRTLRVLCLVPQSCPTLCDPWTVARQALLSMGILQARTLEWVAMPSFRGSSQPRDQT